MEINILWLSITLWWFLIVIDDFFTYFTIKTESDIRKGDVDYNLEGNALPRFVFKKVGLRLGIVLLALFSFLLTFIVLNVVAIITDVLTFIFAFGLIVGIYGFVCFTHIQNYQLLKLLKKSSKNPDKKMFVEEFMKTKKKIREIISNLRDAKH